MSEARLTELLREQWARAEDAERVRDDALAHLARLHDSVERDLHEPDKILCHLQSARSALTSERSERA